jgi:hypothetical protein
MMFVAQAKVTLPDLAHTEEDLKKYMLRYAVLRRLVDHAPTYVALSIVLDAFARLGQARG